MSYQYRLFHPEKLLCSSINFKPSATFEVFSVHVLQMQCALKCFKKSFVCTSVWDCIYTCVHGYAEIRGQHWVLFLRCHLPLFWDRLCHCWNPLKCRPPASASPATRVARAPITSEVFLGFWLRLGFSCLQVKHFAGWAIPLTPSVWNSWNGILFFTNFSIGEKALLLLTWVFYFHWEHGNKASPIYFGPYLSEEPLQMSFQTKCPQVL